MTHLHTLKNWLNRWFPKTLWHSVFISLAICVLFSAVMIYIMIEYVKIYGWTVFVLIPFCVGLISALIYSYKHQRTLWECLAVSTATILTLGILLLITAFEGAICLLLAAPLSLILSSAGSLLGFMLQRQYWLKKNTLGIIILTMLSIPCLMAAESYSAKTPELFAIRSTVDINATPEAVWQNVTEFENLPKTRSWLFHTGIAYPIKAHMYGRGVGAVRHCIFSTGPFVEPITVWDEPHLLRFTVSQQPPAMQELSPYPNIHPPHLDNFLRSEAGQFVLTPLPGNRTRLEGTTWYRHKIWPSSYWRIFSDAIIHEIHLRVLNHIKTISEA